jgi:polyhydroxyalkanoate synthesis regulator phasin
MARSGLSKSQVKSTRAQLIAEGRYPSVDAVRLALGNTGSKSTIHKYLKELDNEEGEGAAPRDDSARQLHELVEQLADTLHLQAEQRLRALRAEHEQAMQHKERELQALRAQVEALQRQLADSAAAHPLEGEAARKGGLGLFGKLLQNNRTGRGHSPFSAMLAAGRSIMFERDELPALKLNN